MFKRFSVFFAALPYTFFMLGVLALVGFSLFPPKKLVDLTEQDKQNILQYARQIAKKDMKNKLNVSDTVNTMPSTMVITVQDKTGTVLGTQTVDVAELTMEQKISTGVSLVFGSLKKTRTAQTLPSTVERIKGDQDALTARPDYIHITIIQETGQKETPRRELKFGEVYPDRHFSNL